MAESLEPPRELTLGEAISIAILLQKNGQLAEAAKLYGAIFETAPDNPDALHYAGVLAHQQGRSDEGAALIERSLVLVPARADCYSNLGNIHQAQGIVELIGHMAQVVTAAARPTRVTDLPASAYAHAWSTSKWLDHYSVQRNVDLQ